MVAEVEGEAPVPKKTDGNSGESSPFKIKLGIALDLIRKIEVSLNGDNERSGDSDWDECKDVQAKRDCIRMLKKCKLSEDKKKKLKQIENELKKSLKSRRASIWTLNRAIYG